MEYSLDTLIPFGKFKGKMIRYVIIDNISYVDWCLVNVKNFTLSKEASEFYNEWMEEKNTEVLNKPVKKPTINYHGKLMWGEIYGY